MPAPKDVCYWRGRVGGLVRDRDREDPELIEARRNLAEANLHHYIQRVLAAAPPLSDEQVSRLRDLLRPNTSQFAGDALDDRDRHTNVSPADLLDFGLPETHDRAAFGGQAQRAGAERTITAVAGYGSCGKCRAEWTSYNQCGRCENILVGGDDVLT